MSFKLPPPPPTNDMSGPVWQSWFYQLVVQLGKIDLKIDLDSSASNLSAQAFLPRESFPLVTQQAADIANVISAQAFAPRQALPAAEQSCTQAANILAGQIFGG